MNLFVLLPLLSFVALIFVWSFVFGQRRKDPVNNAYLIFTGTGATWLGLELLLYVPGLSGYEHLLLHAVIPFWMMTGFLFLNFTYKLIDRRPDLMYWLILAGTMVGIGTDLFTNCILTGHTSHYWGVADGRNPIPHILVCIPNVAGGALGLLLILLDHGKINDGDRKAAYLSILLGGATTLTAMVSMNIIIPDFFEVDYLPRYGSSALVVFSLIIYRAVIKYRFMTMTVDQVAEELFEDMRDGVVLVDGQGTITRTNSAIQSMFGLDPHHVEGMNLDELIPRVDPADDDGDARLEVNRGGVVRIYSVARSNETQGELAHGKILIVRDETEEIEAQEILKRDKDELEVMVLRRTEESLQAQRMEAIGLLTGGVAHDFNNLLTAVMGFATAARDDLAESDPIREDMEEVVLATRRARDIIGQMISISSTTEIEPRQVAVPGLLDEVLNLLEASTPESIKIRRDYGSEKMHVMADITGLHQVIMNIGTNALHAMEESGGTLSVGLTRVDSNVCITMADTGEGIAKNIIDQIFVPFFTTRQSKKGSGLGLAMVLNIIQKHRGTIDVTSEEGKGATFKIYLPWIDKNDGGSRTEDFSIAGGSERILLLDDKEQVLRVEKRMLEPLGYRVTTFSEPQQAIEAIRKNKGSFDLVVTDLSMPDMSGIEFGEQVLQMCPDLPIILVSGNLREDDKARALEIGFGAALSKPLPKAVLASNIRALLQEKKRGSRP